MEAYGPYRCLLCNICGLKDVEIKIYFLKEVLACNLTTKMIFLLYSVKRGPGVA
jgi:hypothetical protein